MQQAFSIPVRPDAAHFETVLLAERDRWVLWLPVALGIGIGLYFALPWEPARWSGPVVVLLASAIAFGVRRYLLPFLLAIACLTVALGFTVAVERARSVAAPVLVESTGAVRLTGRIADVESLEKGARRLLIDHPSFSSSSDQSLPSRLRIKLSPSTDNALSPGQWIELQAVLMPPPTPAAPRAYDFSRQAWFQGIGGVGYAVRAPRLLERSEQRGMIERWRLGLANLRHELTERIVSKVAEGGLDKSVGWVAAALITAERGPVSPHLLQAYRDAGLAHILVIAGMHMSMVAGLVFVALRGGLAAIPAIALRYSIKKWTAVGALMVTFGYLIISGAPVPTQRAFVMNAFVLLALLIDRNAISLRSITWAATLILLLRPEALVSASFQMSFAAVLGLIAGYEYLGPKLSRWRQAHRRRWAMPLFYVAGILLTTQIAGSSTAVYTVFHFNRYATYGLLGNFLAVPLVGFWVMPSALLAFCLMPFGLDGWGWQLMGLGISTVSRVATMVSSLPGASVDIPTMPMLSLVLFTLGGLWLCLWGRRWRLWGLAGMATGLLVAVCDRPPDALVSETGRSIAVRRDDGTLLLSPGKADKAVREAWIRQAGQGGDPEAWVDSTDPALRCDRKGCVYQTEGYRLGLALKPEFLAMHCRDLDLVVAAPLPATPCSGDERIIGSDALKRDGAHALWMSKEGVRIETVRQWQGQRLWSAR